MRRRWAQLVACLPACPPPAPLPGPPLPAPLPTHHAVGNFSGPEAADFLAALHRVAGESSQLLLCTDLWKDEEVLRQAYDDSQGERQAAHFTSAERS